MSKVVISNKISSVLSVSDAVETAVSQGFVLPFVFILFFHVLSILSNKSFLFKEKTESDDTKRFVHAPFTLDPFAFPEALFQQAVGLVPILNILVCSLFLFLFSCFLLPV